MSLSPSPGADSSPGQTTKKAMIIGTVASLLIVILAAVAFWYRRRRQDQAFERWNAGKEIKPRPESDEVSIDPIIPLIGPYLAPQASGRQHDAFSSFLPDVKGVQKKRERHTRVGSLRRAGDDPELGLGKEGEDPLGLRL